MSKLGDHNGKTEFDITDKSFRMRGGFAAGVKVYERYSKEPTGSSSHDFWDEYAPIHAELNRQEPFPGYQFYYSSRYLNGKNNSQRDWSQYPQGREDIPENNIYGTNYRNVSTDISHRNHYRYFSVIDDLDYDAQLRPVNGKVINLHPTKSLNARLDARWLSGTDDTIKTKIHGHHKNLTTNAKTDVTLHENSVAGGGHGGSITTTNLGYISSRYDVHNHVTLSGFRKTLDFDYIISVPPNSELYVHFVSGVWGGSSADRIALAWGKFSEFRMV